ncbi:ABC-2 type transporter [Xylogone sp. PMI_703]|nr:ABC-2 type transporter [Xylogone sp. PMI_703]
MFLRRLLYFLTLSGLELQKQHKEELRPYCRNGLARIHSSVSVEQAEADFEELQREISGLSHESERDGRLKVTDIEKGTALSGGSSSFEDEPFDLETYLRASHIAEEEAGIRPKHLGAYWNGLTVKGTGSSTNYVKTFPDAIVNFFDYVTPLLRLLGIRKKGSEVTLLDSFRGVCNPGEMVLVLGKPGSGCTTFLKSITNQRYGFTDIQGEVLYGSFAAEEFKRYRGEAVYNQEDDVHYATLTVAQTLGFALDTKTAGKLPGRMSKSEFKEKALAMLLKMFNIEHTRDTVVGGPLVRGISGGERKRVSVAEMLCTNASILAWDNSTRGLDSSTALDFVKSLRVYANLYKTTTFVSLYQASENMYRLFDRVLVIDAKKQVYFGPVSEARSYFESLGFDPRPRETTPDYLTGCTDEFVREYAPGYSAANAPHSPGTLEKAFLDSKYSKMLDEEMTIYKSKLAGEQEKHKNFLLAVKESKQRGAGRSVYTVPFYRQVWALMKRQFTLKLQDKTTRLLSWMRTVIIAIVLSTLYLNLPETTGSAFGKGGLLFISLLFNAIAALSELPAAMHGRGIVAKHKSFAFHRPSALWIGQILVDQVFAVAEIMAFSLIVYFTTHLYRSPAAFFTFFLMLFSGNMAMTLFYRTIACISPDFDYAAKFAVVLTTLFTTTSGYLIQYQSEQVWLRWIYYVNILGLAFSSLMENEFSRIEMTCTQETLIPYGPNYTDINHQVCTLPGSTPGTDIVNGSAYIEKAFSYAPNQLWRNWGIIMSIIIFFLIMNVVLGEFIRYGMAGNTARVYQKPNAERKILNQKLSEKREKRQKSKKDSDSSDLKINSTSILTWEGLNYDIPVPGGTRRLLRNVYGYVKPGELTALMGPSGAGKTTLLDVLAARKNIGVITGDILVDGMKPTKHFQRSTSYAEQMDLHDPTQSVREALRFSADLRQPYETPQEEKYAYVEEIISLLELEDLADCIIGSPETGLTVEQRKRVTIGIELAAKPELLLFLDEPTSGLDNQSAFNIVRFLKKLAAAGQAILCTIHQPNTALFDNFDRLLLLKSEGRCVYFGEIGEDSIILRDYFKRHGAIAKDSDNVAEFMLEAIGADWGDIWEESPELANMKQERSVVGRLLNPGIQKEFASPLIHQLKVVIHRTNVAYWRSPNFLFTRFFSHVVISLITGFTYFQLDTSRTSLQDRLFVVFQVTNLPSLIINQVQVMYNIKRSIYFRESSSKMYSSLAFELGILVADLPYSFLCAVTFFLPLYYLPGFQNESSRAGFQFLMIFITELFCMTLGQALAALTPSTFISTQFNPFIMITFSLFCGITIPAVQMPKFWRSWLYQLDPFTRLTGGMVVTAMHQLPIICKPSELNAFTAPEGQTCGEYMADFFAAGGPGYIVNNQTSNCEYCAYSIGDQYYEPLGLSFDNRWRDLGIFLAFVGSNLFIVFMASRFLNFNRR